MGQFSWIAQDTKKQIYNDYDKSTIHMVDPRDGKDYIENDYEGYGVFGGRDFYELFADINRKYIEEQFLCFKKHKDDESFDFFKLKYTVELMERLSFQNKSFASFQEHMLKINNIQYNSDNITELFTKYIDRLCHELIESQNKAYVDFKKIFDKKFEDLTQDDVDYKRQIGIDLWFDYVDPDNTENRKTKTSTDVMSPVLVENYNEWNYYKRYYPKSDMYQGWHWEEQDEQ